jgi:hypothetical protein
MVLVAMEYDVGLEWEGLVVLVVYEPSQFDAHVPCLPTAEPKNRR